jgi:hypothetical protein
VRQTKTSMLALLLLVCAGGLHANGASKASSLETISGCLQSSEGQYSLIDDSQTIHHLVGGAAKLKSYVGRQVEITGKPGVRTSDATPPGGASAAVTQPIFEVKSVKDIAATCKSAGN